MSKIEYIKNNFKNFYERKYEFLGGGEGAVIHNKYGGRSTHCRSAMYSLVKMLKPQNILEIGSWQYECSDIMSLALEESCINGVIDTFDIIKGGYTMGNVIPKGKFVNAHFWMPHHTSSDQWKYSAPLVYKEFINKTNDEIWEFNKSILLGLNKKYDLVFIDGDHSFIGAEFDLKYAQLVSHENTIFVLDDLYEDRNKEVRIFFDNLPYEKYDFEDWNDKEEDLISMGVFIC